MRHLFLALLFCCVFMFSNAQKASDSIHKLDEVVLSDVKLKRYSNGYKVTVLNDSVIRKNGNSLTDLLRFNTNIYFKENGYGMVSSPSFRGTNASQTAVVWNGININSQLNGQVDFNLLSTSNYNNVTIRNGGGSVQYGSGAIGGSIHLANTLNFDKHSDHNIRLDYGSYDTKRASYNASFSNEKLAINVGAAYLDSDNDYKILGTDRKNENGAFKNLDLNFNLGYLVSNKDILKLYYQSFYSDRAFSSTLLAPSNSKYETEDYRAMVEWRHLHKTYTSTLKVAYLSEIFKYFENRDLDNYSKGRATTYLIKHRFEKHLTEAITFNVITDYAYINAEGNSFDDPTRNAFSATAIFSHALNDKLNYNLNIRKDIISDFESPFVASADFRYQLLSFYALKLNASKNFRVPTFNDLYWNPGGNLDLKPEESYQIDLGHQFNFKNSEVKFNAFYIKTSNLIQWRPNAETGYWNPVNVANSSQYGLELEASVRKQLNENHKFLLSSSYAYTIANDDDKDQSLFYVPKHKINASLAYDFKALQCFYQHLINGEVQIIGGDLRGYNVANLGVDYRLNNNGKLKYTLGLRVNNIYNKYYENVALRPMPNRNYNLNLNLNF